MLLSGLDPDRRDQVNSSTRDAAQVRPVGAARGQASSARKGCEKGTGQEVPRRRGDVQRPADTADPRGRGTCVRPSQPGRERVPDAAGVTSWNTAPYEQRTGPFCGDTPSCPSPADLLLRPRCSRAERR